MADRYPRLLEIAAAYTEKELANEDTVGESTQAEIRVWLQSRGLELRRASMSVAHAMQMARLALDTGKPAGGRPVVARSVPPGIVLGDELHSGTHLVA